MALSQPLSHLFPSTSIPSSSPFPTYCFPTLQATKQSSTKTNYQKPDISHSHPILEIADEANPQTNDTSKKKKKKKKKLKPGFYDQTRERWSIKITSQRAKFPWQEEREQKYIEYSRNILPASVPPQFSEANVEIEKPTLGKPANFLLGTRVVSAPWAHGSQPRKTHLNSKPEASVSDDPTEESHIGGEKAKSAEFHGESGKSIVGMIVERLKDFTEEENSNFNAVASDFRASLVEEKKLESCGDNGVSLDVKSVGSASNAHNFVELEDEISNSCEQIANSLNYIDFGISIQHPRDKERRVEGERWRRSNTELAEKMIPEPELRRLQNVALRKKERIKVGATGITQALVDEIHDKWKEEEVVKFRFEGPPSLNMKRTHEVLERKTGGLVIWRSGCSLVLYRGMTYKLPCVQSYTKHTQANQNTVSHSKESSVYGRATEVSNAPSGAAVEDVSEEFMDIMDANEMLDELGPRFQDWSGIDPVPVDADLLPTEVPGYKPPFRLLPYGTRPCLHNKQMTSLRRLARRVPPHFALGRNRQHQGLAMSMVKLWEKSAIAKIAIKRGVPNTCNERMAEELKKLTGGTLISRNREYIVFYRGNDFLSPAMKEALIERQKLAKFRQEEEEQARLSASTLIASNAKTAKGPFVAGTLAETVEATSRWGSQPSTEEREKMLRAEALAKHASLVRYLEKKLIHAKQKVRKAEKALGKVQEFLKPADLPTDLETITDEERFLFRKIGLSMKSFLLVGRRGVFDGTVENMHLHWKYRELVKIIIKGMSFAQVKHVAISLEAESGGVLISLDKTTKGYAIIFYRGKNYSRPQTLRPKNLLSRRQALARSIELQRREALNHHLLGLQERIDTLKAELDQMEAAKETGNEDLYTRLNGAYSSDSDMEDEGEEAYLETYQSGDEDSNPSTTDLVLENGSISSCPE